VTELPPPAAGCAACAARDQVIAELGRAVEELRAEVFDGAQDSYGGGGEAALGMPMRV